MKSKFKCVFESFMAEKSEKEDIEKQLADIEAQYGEGHVAAIRMLLDISKKYTKKLIKFRKENPKPSLKPNAKGVVPDYDNKIKKIEFINSEVKKLYEEKLAEMGEIVDKAKTYNIPTDNDECQLEYVLGNSKVGEDTIIINMGPATICDAARAGECELYSMGFCYAQNNETTYKTALVKRYKEKLQWKTMDSDTIASLLASQIARLRSTSSRGKSIPVKFVRFNEAGDFESEDDKKKLGEVVNATNKLLAQMGEDKVTFYTYTHRSDLFQNGVNDIPAKDLIIQGSGFYSDNEKGEKKRPFFVDNCFMGMDYPNLVNLVRNGRFEELVDELGIDLEDARLKSIKICRGACLDCNYCKSKTPKLIIVCYHGTGTTVQSISRQMPQILRKLFKNAAGEAMDVMGLPDEIKNQLFNMTHFNENELVDRLIGYGSYTKSKSSQKWQRPVINLDTIIPFLKYVREVFESELKDIVTDQGVKISKPRTDYLINGRKATDAQIQGVIDAAKKKNKKREEEFLAAGIIPEKYTWFNVLSDELLTEEKKTHIADGGMLYLANLSVANLLNTNKQFVNPEQVQSILNDAEYNVDVTSDLEGEEVAPEETEPELPNEQF